MCVTITVTTLHDDRDNGDSCAGITTVELTSPLAGREVVDGNTGTVVALGAA